MNFFTTHFLNKIQNICLYFTAFIFILSCSLPASFADEYVGDVIILFDQSASMKDYDPKLISKVWMLAFIKTFKKPYNVLLVGFDDRLHEHVKATMKNKKDIETLRDKIKRIRMHGLTTDLEAPLRYLLEHNDSRPITLAVIISDGEPEIWDEKRWYLSKKIRTDNRYEELNKQYRSLKAQGFTKKELYNRLKNLYHARNLELINQRLAKLKEKLGGKLVFLDISGNFDFFESWAKAANAQFIPANARDDEYPVKALRSAIIAIQEKASAVLSEELPSEHEERTEPVPEPESVEEPVAVTPPQPQIPVKPPTASCKESPPLKTDVKVTDKEKLSRSWMIVLWVIILLMAAIFFSVLFRYRKRVKPALEEVEWTKDKIRENQTPEQVDAKLKKLSSSSIKDANKFIENEIQMAINDADKEHVKLLDAEKDRFRFDKQDFMRIPLRPGAMIVHWINKKGDLRHGNAINISMDSVIFEAADFDDGRIDVIECPGLDITFHVKQSSIISNESGLVVATLDEFRYNIDDRIKWVETMTRIEEETQ